MKSNFQIILLEDLYDLATRVDTKLSTYAFVLIFSVSYILSGSYISTQAVVKCSRWEWEDRVLPVHSNAFHIN